MFWLMTLFSGFLIHAILLAGILVLIAATFLKILDPILSPYKLVGQILGIVLLLVGTYYEGALGYKQSQAAQVANLEKQLHDATLKSTDKNTQIKTRIVHDTQVVHEQGDAIVQYIEKEAPRIDANCTVPADVIQKYNEAATGITSNSLGTSFTQPKITSIPFSLTNSVAQPKVNTPVILPKSNIILPTKSTK